MIKAGYSARVAAASGSRMLRNVKILERIEELQRETTDKLKLSRERVLLEAMRLGFSAITQFLEVDENGQTKFRAIDQLTEDALAAIQVITVTASGNLRIKLHDKLGPLKLLAQHLGLLKPQPKEEPEEPLLKRIREMDPAEREARIEHLIERYQHFHGAGPRD